MYTYNAELIKVIDGDTVIVMVDLGMEVHIRAKLRLYGINAYELHDPDPTKRELAQKGKQFLEDNWKVGDIRVIQTHKDEKEKYGRYLAEIFDVKIPTTYNELLIHNNLAVVYYGKNEVTE